MIRSKPVGRSRIAATSAALAAAALALGLAAPAAAEPYVKFSGHVPGSGTAADPRANQISPSQSGRLGGRSGSGSSGISSRWIELESWSLGGAGAANTGLARSGPGTLVLNGSIANCRVGDRYRTAELREGRDGAVSRLEGVQITACGDDTVSLNFTAVAG